MFGLFGSKSDRADDEVAKFLQDRLPAAGLLTHAALSDPYCVGFLQMAGIHVATQFLPKGNGFDDAAQVFLRALTRVVPNDAHDVAEALQVLGKDENFLSGRKDGDLYMGWSLLHIAPEFEAKVALQRFKDRVVDLDTQKMQTSKSGSLNSGNAGQPGTQRAQSVLRLTAGAWEVDGGGHEYSLSRTWSSAETKVKAIVTVRSSREVNSILSELRFNFEPLRIESERSLILGFYTDEPKGALAEVKALPVPQSDRSRLLDVVLIVHEKDTHKLLRALAAGHDLHFALMNPASPEKSPFLTKPIRFLRNLLLANDGEFKTLHIDVVEKVSICQDATRARQLSEAWYRRRTPGKDFDLS